MKSAAEILALLSNCQQGQVNLLIEFRQDFSLNDVISLADESLPAKQFIQWPTPAGNVLGRARRMPCPFQQLLQFTKLGMHNRCP